MKNQASSKTLTDKFKSSKGNVPKKKRPAPFSIRLTEDERAYLSQKAGSRPLATYIRDQLLGDMAEKRRVHRNPSINDKQVAALLAKLGQSRIPNNLNQLAKAANCGTLDISENIEQELRDAYAAVIEMRKALFIALGFRSEGKI